jgi:alkylation response protein AidB-like acyl-CoA dehydrogenase
MSTAAVPALSNHGLTVLSEEEELFRASVREFAEGEIRPKVEAMEHAGKLDPDLIKQCFELGLMAIESPEEYGGAGRRS